MPKSRRNCCVVGCHNTEESDENVKFYSFPGRAYETEKQAKWIKAVNRKKDGSLWKPTRNSRICSTHFVGGKKSTIESHPAYIPTIFPASYKKRSKNVETFARFDRTKSRKLNDPNFTNFEYLLQTGDVLPSQLKVDVSTQIKVDADSNELKIEPIVNSEMDMDRCLTASAAPCADINFVDVKTELLDSEMDADCLISCTIPFVHDYSAIEPKVEPGEFKIEPEDLMMEPTLNVQDISYDPLNLGQSETDNLVDPLSLEGFEKHPISDKNIEEIEAHTFKNVQGKIIEPDQKQLIFEIFLDLQASGQSKSQSVKLTAKKTGFSESSIWRMITEKITIGNFSAPLKTKQRKCMYEKLNEAQLETVRQMYRELSSKSKPPTLRNLLQEVNKSNLLPRMSRDTLWKLLKRLGLM